MASSSGASPRCRIDQFYPSRKRKPAGKDEKDPENLVPVDVSCSAKGSLDGFLLESPGHRVDARENDDGGVHRFAPRGPTVKRNLTREIGLGLDAVKSASAIGKEDVQSKCGESGDDCVETGDGKPGLKKFAADFLSLYCSDVPPSETLKSEQHWKRQKRNVSPFLAENDKTCLKKHRLVNGIPSLEIDAKDPPGDGSYDHMSHELCDKAWYAVAVGSAQPEVNVGRDPMECDRKGASFSSLRRCSNRTTPKSNLVKTWSSALDPSGNILVAHQTPRSALKTSPGEEFWDEAIQVADLLVAPADTLSVQSAKNYVVEDKKSPHHPCFIGSQRSNNKVVANKSMHGLQYQSDIELSKSGFNEIVDDNRQMENGSCLEGLKNCIEEMKSSGYNDNKDASPMPVRHFDFLNEDSILKENNSNDFFVKEDTNRLQNSDTSAHSEAPAKRNVHSRKPPISFSKVSCKSKDDSSDFVKPPQSSYFLAPKNCMGGRRDGNNPLSGNMDVPLPTMKISFDHEATTPSSNKPRKDSLLIHNWLPQEICNIYTRKGMSSLYPWQVECLQIDGVLDRRNLVYCASTSAGKSFVAEILMLRRVISTSKMAILVLPYVSICAEKASHLEVLLEPLGKHVRSFYGNQGGGSLPKDTSVAVCTIEKANSLVNRLLEEGRLSEVGIIVIDELHMVGDQHRGYLLELLLTKLRYASGGGSSEPSSGESSGSSSGKTDLTHGLQVVGMSATMPNVSAVADWLQAALYQTDFRPVPLEEYIKVGNSILNRKMEIVRTFTKTSDLGGRDPDHIVELCNEIVQEGHSVLCFCSSRKGCESTAKHISKFLKEFSSSNLEYDSAFSDVFSAIEALRKSPSGLDPTLEETLPHGVAYHHAGLTVEEREIVETCYRKGLIRVLAATSTLAAGVNLPARRVIFRQPRIGRDFIDGTRYRQMAGRAGRTGIDTKGESILICKPEELKKIASILNDSCPPLQSCLSDDKNGMVHAILEVVSGGIVQTANDIHRYVRCTLLNSTKPFKDVVKSAQDSLHWLCHKKFLQWNEETKLYNTTPLGRASFGSSLCPEESLVRTSSLVQDVVLDDLSRAREGFVLASDLHLVYLVTPINVNVEPDWELYYERFMELSPLNQSVGNRVGVAEPFLMRMAHGAPMPVLDRTRGKSNLHTRMQSRGASGSSNCSSEIQILRVSKRFYVALMLSRLVQEVPITDVCDSFKVARGMIQSLQENAGRFASMVAVFCERLGWHDLEGLIAKFQNRVSFGVRAEIVELTTIPCVKGSRARALYKAGLRTPLAIAEASTTQIAKALFEGSSWAVQEDSGTRRIQLALAKKIKNGARKIVLDKAEEASVAAFSAYKSLGIQVPQFSVPSLLSKAKVSEMQIDILKSYTQGAVSSMEKEEYLHVSTRPSSEHMKDGHDNLLSMNLRNDNTEEITGSKANASPESISSESLRNNFSTSEHGIVTLPTVPLARPDEIRTENQASDLYTDPTIGGIEEDQKCDIQQGNDGASVYNTNSYPTCDKGPISASSIPGGFDSFMHQWESVQEFYFSIHFSKKNTNTDSMIFDIFGLAICWKNSPIYYINLSRYLKSSWKINTSGDSTENSVCSESKSPSQSDLWEISEKRWNRIANVLGKNGVRKITWNLKSQIHALQNPGISVRRLGGGLRNQHKTHSDFRLIDGTLFLPSVILNDGIDVCLVVWILWPDEESGSCPKLDKVVKKCLSAETASAAVRDGRWRNQMRKAAHNGCCLRVSQTRALTLVLWKLLVSEGLVEPFIRVESPLVKVLADMEIWGIGVDVDGCLRARHVLGKKLKELEKEAFKLAGFSFSLYSTADIANVLYTRLKLPIPEACNKGKQHPSTNKHSLDLLRDEHPIISVIKEHRSLSKLLNSTLGSICTKSQLCLKSQRYKIKGHWLQTSTATGRLSMEEPNLQCVEHPIELTTHNLVKDASGASEADFHLINARNFFVPTQENWVIVTADYSQIELRLMAHFSRDTPLIELLSRPDGDVFTMLAAKWTGKLESTIKSKEREQTKRLVYGILYGMGANTLAEQLDCNPDEAGEKIRSFKALFPGVSAWLQDAVAFCCGNGYVETLLGRKRFLSKIKFGDHKEKAKAQRQAVNSICQGSAADIIKTAMINIHSVIVGGGNVPTSENGVGMQYSMLKGQCRILLQVHDELLLEVNPCLVKEAASLLQVTMEGAASLLVPLHVKLKVGRTWGSLESFDPK